MKISMIVIACFVILFIVSLGTMCKDAILADKKVVLRNGTISETAYAFYLPNGVLERIKVYRSTAARTIAIVPFTIKEPQLEWERHKYGL